MLSTLALALACCTARENGPPPLSSPTFDKALLILQKDAHDADPTVRANCIEALQVSADPRAAEIIEQGLHDDEWVVRFAAAMAAGVRKLDTVRPVLNTLVEHDPSGSVRAGCIYALHQMGDSRHMSELFQLLQRLDAPTRANTAMVLGSIGENGAIPILQMAADDRDIRVKFEITRALARLGDENSVKVVDSWALNKFSEDQLNAMIVAKDLDPNAGRNILLLGLQGPPNEFPKDFTDRDKNTVRNLTLQRQLLAAASMARLGDGSGAQIALDNLKNPEPRFRALAVLALGEMMTSFKAPRLDSMLSDADPGVRRAAAAAVVKIYARAAKGKL
jgi:HEAT repeat protein